jgi:hypothetical protein
MIEAVPESTAEEEATHGFLHFYFGHKLIELVVSTNDAECRCRFSIPDVETPDFLLERTVTACAGRRFKTETEWLGSKDYRGALECALKLSGNDDEAAGLLLKWATRCADVITEKHRAQVSRLTYELLCQERLTGDEVAKIIERVTPGAIKVEPLPVAA